MLNRLRPLTSSVPLVLNAKECASLTGPSVVPIDVSWHMPAAKRNPRADYLRKRLPRARFLDLDAVATLDHPLALPHMMPSAATFAAACEKLGVTRESHVVLYDSVGVFSSPRALFMFKAFGHEKASILNGGLPAWQSENYPVEEDESTVTQVIETKYLESPLNEAMVKSYEDMLANNATSPAESDDVALVLDARAAPRFDGTAPEPRAGMSSGHMPNSFSMPFNKLLEEHSSSSGTYTTIRDATALRSILEEAIQGQGTLTDVFSRSFITTCGSGMTAAIIWLALQQVGVGAALYDESWMGYASREASPIVKKESS